MTVRVGIVLDGEARGAVAAGEEAAEALRSVGEAADEAARAATAAAEEIAGEMADTARATATASDAVTRIGTQADASAGDISGLVAALTAAQREANDLTRAQMALATAQADARARAAALAAAEREQARAARDAARAAADLARGQREQERATEAATREAERQRKVMVDGLTATATRALGLVIGIEALKRGWGALSAAASDHYARSEELTGQLDALKASTDGVASSILGTVANVETSEIVFGAFQTAADRVAESLQNTALSSDTARQAAALALRVMAGGVTVLRGLHSGYVAVRLALIAGEAAQYAWSTGILRAGVALGSFVTGSLASFLGGLTDIARAALPAADFLGDGVGGALASIVAAGDAATASLRATSDGASDLADEMRDQAARAMASYRAEAERAVEQATVLDAALESVRDILLDTADAAAAGQTSLRLLGETARVSGQEAADAYDKAKDALEGYLQAKWAQVAAEQAAYEAAKLALLAVGDSARVEKIKSEAMEIAAVEAELQANLTRIAEEGAQARMAAERAAAEAYQAAQTARAQSVVQSLGAVLAGQERVVTATRRVLGDELAAMAEQYAAIAIASALSGRFGAAAGYAAGAVALSAGAAALGSSSGSGAVAAAAPVQTTIQQQRTDITINASGVLNDSTVDQIARGVELATQRGRL